MQNSVITLEKMNVRTIYQVFEDAFSNYFVKFEKNADVHIDRWLTAGVDFSLSYGVKVDGVLGAFILHAPKEDFVMNLATGVAQRFQGQGLTGLMYQKIKEELPLKGFRKGRLEVITENHKAIRAYEKAGFEKKRLLRSWKGVLREFAPCEGTYLIGSPELTPEHESLSPYPWSFEQETSVISRRASALELHELRSEDELIAYAVWNPWKMNLVQLGGKDEKSLFGILSSMKLSGEHAGMINVDERNTLVNEVLNKAGMSNYLSQYEMEGPF